MTDGKDVQAETCRPYVGAAMKDMHGLDVAAFNGTRMCLMRLLLSKTRTDPSLAMDMLVNRLSAESSTRSIY